MERNDDIAILQDANHILTEASAPKPNQPPAAENPGDWKPSGDRCEKTFSRPSALKRYLSSVHLHTSAFRCHIDVCLKPFTRLETLERHIETQHGTGKIACPSCRKLVRKDGLDEHQTTPKCCNATNALATTAGISTNASVGHVANNTTSADTVDEVSPSQSIRAPIRTTSEESASSFSANRKTSKTSRWFELPKPSEASWAANFPSSGYDIALLVRPYDLVFYEDKEHDPRALLNYNPRQFVNATRLVAFKCAYLDLGEMSCRLSNLRLDSAREHERPQDAPQNE